MTYNPPVGLDALDALLSMRLGGLASGSGTLRWAMDGACLLRLRIRLGAEGLEYAWQEETPPHSVIREFAGLREVEAFIVRQLREPGGEEIFVCWEDEPTPIGRFLAMTAAGDRLVCAWRSEQEVGERDEQKREGRLEAGSRRREAEGGIGVHITLVVASSADGKISTCDGAGPRFTSSADKELLRRLRAEADAVIVGAGTVANDNPAYKLPDAMKADRLARGMSETPIRAVISGRGSVSPEARLFRNHASPTLVFATNSISEERFQRLSEVATVYRVGEPNVDAGEVVRILRDEYGVRRILLEGGGEVNYAFLSAGLVDEVCLTVAPYLVGGREVASPVGGEGFALADIVPLRLVSTRIVENDVFLRYQVIK